MQYDYIIIGSGASGAVLAAELVAHNHTVLLLERGPEQSDYPDTFAARDWGKVFVSSAMHELAASRLETMGGNRTILAVGSIAGGSSTINSMMYGRGQLTDYAKWTDSPLWSSDRITSAFSKIESKLKVSLTPQTDFANAFVQACHEVGLKQLENLDAEDYAGVGYNLTTTYEGQRASTNTVFLNPLRDKKNFTFLTNAQVMQILFDANKKATGVVYVTEYQQQVAELAPEGEVILSAGALASPQLLMLSGIGSRDALQQHGIAVVADNPAVGQHLLDQPDCPVVYRAKKTMPQDVTQIQVCAFVRSDSALPDPDLQILFFPGNYMVEMAKMGLRGMPAALTGSLGGRRFLRAMMAVMNIPGLKQQLSKSYFIMPCLMRPKSEGQLQLASADPFAEPIVDLNYFAHPDDAKALISGLRIAQDIGRAQGLSAWCASEIMPRKMDLMQYIKRNAGTTYHYAGTCALGSVVEADLTVKGVQGLRVADASIMPSLPVCTPNAACMMIGYNAAQIILGQR